MEVLPPINPFLEIKDFYFEQNLLLEKKTKSKSIKLHEFDETDEYQIPDWIKPNFDKKAEIDCVFTIDDNLYNDEIYHHRVEILDDKITPSKKLSHFIVQDDNFIHLHKKYLTKDDFQEIKPLKLEVNLTGKKLYQHLFNFLRKIIKSDSNKFIHHFLSTFLIFGSLKITSNLICFSINNRKCEFNLKNPYHCQLNTDEDIVNLYCLNESTLEITKDYYKIYLQNYLYYHYDFEDGLKRYGTNQENLRLNVSDYFLLIKLVHHLKLPFINFEDDYLVNYLNFKSEFNYHLEGDVKYYDKNLLEIKRYSPNTLKINFQIKNQYCYLFCYQNEELLLFDGEPKFYLKTPKRTYAYHYNFNIISEWINTHLKVFKNDKDLKRIHSYLFDKINHLSHYHLSYHTNAGEVKLNRNGCNLIIDIRKNNEINEVFATRNNHLITHLEITQGRYHLKQVSETNCSLSGDLILYFCRDDITHNCVSLIQVIVPKTTNLEMTDHANFYAEEAKICQIYLGKSLDRCQVCDNRWSYYLYYQDKKEHYICNQCAKDKADKLCASLYVPEMIKVDNFEGNNRPFKIGDVVKNKLLYLEPLDAIVSYSPDSRNSEHIKDMKYFKYPEFKFLEENQTPLATEFQEKIKEIEIKEFQTKPNDKDLEETARLVEEVKNFNIPTMKKEEESNSLWSWFGLRKRKNKVEDL